MARSSYIVPQSDLLTGRGVLLTGAAGAVGRGIAAALTAQGARVHGLDRIAGEGVATCDVTDETSLARAIDAMPFPLTDIVHAAGTLIVGPLAKTELADYRAAVEANLTSAFLVGREGARRLGNGGTLQLVASQAGLKSGSSWGVYSAVKAGVIRLAEALAQELGPRGVRVNAICPGNVESPMGDRWLDMIARERGITAAELKAGYLKASPTGRFADPAEIGGVCAMLMSPLANYVSGVALLADGGELSG